MRKLLAIMRFQRTSGIALGPILFIIAILAVLAAAIAAGVGGFNANTNLEGAKAQAHAIITYADQIKDGIDLAMANGCADTQLDFSGTPSNNPSNPNAPADGSCKIFDPRGGGVLWRPEIANTGTVGSNRCFIGLEPDLKLVDRPRGL